MNTETANETVNDEQLQQEQQSEETEVEATESTGADEQEGDEDEDDEADSNGEESGDRRKKPKRPRWSDVNRAQREALEARRELEELRRKHEQPQQTEQAPEKPQGKPSLEQFDYDQDAYLEALADWKLDQREQQRTQQATQQREQQTMQERQAALAAKEAEFIAAHPDYEGVAKAPHVPITKQMAEVMIENPDTAPAIAYYLGQNIGEATEIAQMSPVAAARAIGRIEASLSNPSKPPPPKPVKKAPAVVPTLQPGASASKDWRQMTTEEHIRAYQNRKKSP